MTTDGEKIHTLVKENLEYFKAEKDSEDWKKYIEYLDDLVLDGFFECVCCSLKYLMENMDKEKSSTDMPPLLEAKFELQVSPMLKHFLSWEARFKFHSFIAFLYKINGVVLEVGNLRYHSCSYVQYRESYSKKKFLEA